LKKMNYNQSVEYLFGLQRFGWKLGLERIHKLLDAFDNPQQQVPFVHVAGTNGKGSVSAMLASICHHAGYRTGLYTSPHLQDVRERIRINDQMISKKMFADIVNQLIPVTYKLECTFFEVITALAFVYFAAQQAEIVVLETGLGGRFDATNVVTPVLSIITSIDYEHTEHLGTDLVSIAKEKAGIIKKSIPCIIGNLSDKAEKTIVTVCQGNNSALYRAKALCLCQNICQQTTYNAFDIIFENKLVGKTTLPLPGEQQINNAQIAVSALKILRKKSFKIENKHIIKGLNNVYWPGRLQTISLDPYIIVDVAHNIASFQQLYGILKKLSAQYEIIFIFGLLKDKNLQEIVKIISPIAHQVIAVQAQSERSYTVETIKKEFHTQKISVKAFKTVKEGLIFSIKHYKKGQLLCITGSHFVVGEALNKIKNLTS